MNSDYEMLMNMTREEPLCEELLPYVHQGSIGLIIHHPLIISLAYDPIRSALINEQYRAKSQLLAKLVEQKEFSKAIFLHERPYRFDALMEYRTDYDFHDWETIGHIWTDSENIYETLDDWKWLWSSNPKGREKVMSPEERFALAALPEQFDVYRGISHSNDDEGMSWTTDLQKATWFARRFTGQPRVLHGRVKRSDVYAYFTGRDESEIVVDPEFVELI